jgi:hypothetical protein
MLEHCFSKSRVSLSEGIWRPSDNRGAGVYRHFGRRAMKHMLYHLARRLTSWPSSPGGSLLGFGRLHSLRGLHGLHGRARLLPARAQGAAPGFRHLAVLVLKLRELPDVVGPRPSRGPRLLPGGVQGAAPGFRHLAVLVLKLRELEDVGDIRPSPRPSRGPSFGLRHLGRQPRVLGLHRIRGFHRRRGLGRIRGLHGLRGLGCHGLHGLRGLRGLGRLHDLHGLRGLHGLGRLRGLHVLQRQRPRATSSLVGKRAKAKWAKGRKRPRA